MSRELSEYDIRVNAISPGVIKTYKVRIIRVKVPQNFKRKKS